MAALRAHKSSQESSPSRFVALPQELQIRCVEFLALGDAASLAKQLSKGTRTAARRALTRGRWRPVCEVARNGKATIEGVMGSYMTDNGTPLGRARTWQERLAGLSDASRALFREAWALEPAEVLFILLLWTRDSYHEAYLFLCLVEPSTDGLRRILAACEYSHREFARRAGHSGRPSLAEDAEERECHPGDLVAAWSRAIGAPLFFHQQPNLLGDELECWEDPAQAAGFVLDMSGEYGQVWLDETMYGGIPNYIIDKARAYCARWEDQTKAAAFIYPFMKIQFAADELENDFSANFGT
ncbi:unnamed protein product [Pelagomonas calceolata]|uniref:Uncharacterized protein n=1 Tax=Pelagomonas calceolata TaxID=35677 RepID=A0A8J2X3L9_9STRA|nr:unnamed protein product [Pelagomonas calceolata]|mmetsp:Transcript_7825/g.23172  ORF Transcript_7825/g.23172 Transcript_7825/m.23172 type:complete len:299 (-) Transcript_7825:90-986(-)